MKQKVLLLGSNGLLGKVMKKKFSANINYQLFTAARNDADFCFDFTEDDKLDACFKKIRPDLVINCAALVNLSFCESNKSNAYLINARFVSKLICFCEQYKSYFLHISTDHYYNGDGLRKHSELDPLIFLNEYARTKFCAEQFALQYKKSLIIRTNIVGFKNATTPTFLEWVINSIKSGEELNLFNDFYTSSIHTYQFVDIVQNLLDLGVTGLYNVASSNVFSKKEFILALSNKFFGCLPAYKETSVKSLGCSRADSLGLDTSKVEKLLGYTMPTMDEVIQSVYEEYKRLI